MHVVRNERIGATHRTSRFARIDSTRFAVVLGLTALVSLGVFSHAPADHTADHAAAVPVAGADATRDRAPVTARTTGSAEESASSALQRFTETSPALAELLGLGEGIVIGDSNEDQFLDPDVAFVLSAAATGSDAIEARWDIAEGYYLYRKKFRFKAADGSGASLREAGFPPGKVKDDEYFGPMEVYYGSVAALVPVARSPAEGPFDVDITYQGCADAGLCYPPITKTVSLLMPAALADTGPGTGAGGGALGLSDAGSGRGAAGQSSLQARVTAGGNAPGASALSGSGTPGVVPSVPELPVRDAEGAAPIEMPEQDRVATALMSGNRLLVILSLFGAGLLLTFTPCVLPMVPILTSIIVGQGKERDSGGAPVRRAFMLSLVYVLAMALTYTAAGVLAGLFGANLAAAFQDPWIVSAFALVFVLLALSMFGFYELQMPASWQAGLAALSRRQRGGTYARGRGDGGHCRR